MHQGHYWGNPWYNHWGKRYVGISQDLSTLKDVNGFDLMLNSDLKDNSSPSTVICMQRPSFRSFPAYVYSDF
jgi:hypothetical protein